MSEEIRYWRESVTAQPLSPLIPLAQNEREDQEAEEITRSRPVSYAVASSPSPRGIRRSIGPDEPWTNADLSHLRDRITKLEGHVSHLQMTVDELMRRLAVQPQVDDPSLAEVLHPGRVRDSNRSSLVPGTERWSGQQHVLRHQMAARRGQLYESPVDLGLRSAFSSDKVSGSSVDLGSEREQDKRLSTVTALAGRRLSDRPQTAVLLDYQSQVLGEGEHVKPSGERSAHLSAFEGRAEARRGSGPLPQLVTTGSPLVSQRDNGLPMEEQSMGRMEDEPTPDETASFTASEAFITPTEDRTFGLGSYDDDDDVDEGNHGMKDDEEEDEDDTWNTNRTKSTMEQGGLSVNPVSNPPMATASSTSIRQELYSDVEFIGNIKGGYVPESAEEDEQQQGLERRSAQRTMSLGRLTAGNNNPPVPEQPLPSIDTSTLDRRGESGSCDSARRYQHHQHTSGGIMAGFPPSPILPLPSSMAANNTSATIIPTSTSTSMAAGTSTPTTMDPTRRAFESTTLI